METTAPEPTATPASPASDWVRRFLHVGTIIFNVPVAQIALILVGADLATLATTYLPARSASRIAPAEALRYE